MNLPVLLIVDDEKPTRDALRLGLEDDFDVYCASNLEEAAVILESEPVEAVLTDLRLGGDSGMDVLDLALKSDSKPVCVMMTAYGSVDTAVEAMRHGAYHFVTKPLNLDEIDLLLKRALKSSRLEQENARLQQCLDPSGGLEKLLGRSKAMESVFRLIRQVAPTKATVLIEGESGTGKELVGAAIHALSGRPKDRLVVVNCAALSPQLLESELFGHEKGAFTGAMQRRLGKFEQADGGTLFLDEIGEIDANTQVKLLRALSERTIERVGGNESIKVDIRLIAATNKSLKQLVEEGKFREDLYFRLNVVKIDMPPLRTREEDIMILASAFLKELAKENDKPVHHLTEQAKRVIRSYPWPGNVRELKTAIEHGVVMAEDAVIDVDHLPKFLQSHVSQEEYTGNSDISSEVSSIALNHAGASDPTVPVESPSAQVSMSSELPDPVSEDDFNLEKATQRLIQQALDYSGGNKTRAAELLGIDRRTLQRKLADFIENGL